LANCLSPRVRLPSPRHSSFTGNFKSNQKSTTCLVSPPRISVSVSASKQSCSPARFIHSSVYSENVEYVKTQQNEDDLVGELDVVDRQSVFKDMTLEEIVLLNEKMKSGSLPSDIDSHSAAGELEGSVKARLFHVKEKDPVKHTIDLMLRHHIGCVLVVAKNENASDTIEMNNYRGMLTARDFLHKPAKSLEGTLVGEVMNTIPVFMNAADNCIDAISKMLTENLRHILVRKDGKIIGLVAKADLLKLFRDYKEKRTGFLMNYIQGRYGDC